MPKGLGFPKKVSLKDGRTATIDLLSEKDSPREMRAFINGLVDEGAMISWKRCFSLKEERGFLDKRLDAFRRGEGYLLVARVGGRIAGDSGAERKEGKAMGNVEVGIGIAKPYRRIGLGEALLRENIALAERFFKPKNLVLTVFAENRRARSLYKKLGFKPFAVFPDWILHKGKYMDMIFMKLDQTLV
ncbi:MAG: GNAT family N-acetyltransferase [Candidatus Micrarchaeota archaeon]